MLDQGYTCQEIAFKFSCSTGHIHNLKTILIRRGDLIGWRRHRNNEQRIPWTLDWEIPSLTEVGW